MYYLSANFLKICFQFSTLDIQWNGYLRKIFCKVTNFHNKLSKLASSNRMHLIFNASFFQIRTISIYLQKDLRKRVSLSLNDVFDRIKILLLFICLLIFRVCWQIIKRKPEIVDNKAQK